MTLEWSENPVFTVKPVQGALALLPQTRNYQFVLRGYHENISVKVLVDGKETDVEVTSDEATCSVIVEVTADVTSEIKLVMTGEMLITGNGDPIKRCSNLMQKAYFDMGAKEEVMAILRNPDESFKAKLRKLNFKLANSIEHQELIEALLEQLTLVE